ncbi:MAG: hypothetical protein HND57_16405 [Planctomycetes bacterium]|nr:hypothetical protein [Planctomycetota bacterium]
MTTSSLPPSEPQQPTGAPGPGAFGSRQQQQQQQQNRPREPKRVRNGVRLDIEEIPPGTTERSAAWIRLFSAEVEPHIIEQGMEYARKGQTISLTLVPGHVRARIQGTHTRPYSVELAFPLMSDDVWNRLISVLAEQSRLIAQILSGRLPSRVDRLVQTFGTPLMPEPH